MAKEGFSWKGLFINEEGGASEKESVAGPSHEPEVSHSTTFPTSATSGTGQSSEAGNPFLDEIIGTYEKGFESLNIPDFDFYELYQSVMMTGVNNVQGYQMAFNIGKSIKGDLTKDLLIEKSKYYITEIEKVHRQYDTRGRAKKLDLDRVNSKDKTDLSKRIKEIQEQMASLQKELQEKTAKLEKVDVDATKGYGEVELKLKANDYAKKRILDSINQVVAGINQYL